MRASGIVTTNNILASDRHEAVCIYLGIVSEIIGESFWPTRLPGSRSADGGSWYFEHDDRRTPEAYAAGARTLHDERTVVMLEGCSVAVTSEPGPTSERSIASLLALPRMPARGRTLIALGFESAAL